MQNLITKNQASKFWSYCSKCPPKKCNLQTPLEQWLKSKEAFLYFWNMSACERNPSSGSSQDTFSALLFCWHWLHFSKTISMPIVILTNAFICIHYLQPESRHVLTVNPTKLPNISDDYAKLWRAWLVCVGVTENAYRLIQHVFWALINPMQIICKHNTNNFQQFDGHHLPQKTQIGWCCCDSTNDYRPSYAESLKTSRLPGIRATENVDSSFPPWDLVYCCCCLSIPEILLPSQSWKCKWKLFSHPPIPAFCYQLNDETASEKTLLSLFPDTVQFQVLRHYCSFQITVCCQLYQCFFWLSII